MRALSTSTENGGNCVSPPYWEKSHDAQVLPTHVTKRKNVQKSCTFCSLHQGHLSGSPMALGTRLKNTHAREVTCFSAKYGTQGHSSSGGPRVRGWNGTETAERVVRKLGSFVFLLRGFSTSSRCIRNFVNGTYCELFVLWNWCL